MKNFSNYTDYDKKDNLHFESKAVHGALGTEPLTGAVSMPIFQAVTYRHPALGESTGFAYSRLENPTRQELERTMAILEGGIKAFAFSSAQTKIIKKLGGGVRLALAQYRELAAFAQFASDLDDVTRKQLERGRVVTELMKQPQYQPLQVWEEALVLYAVNMGAYDDVAVADALRVERGMREYLKTHHADLIETIEAKKELSKDVDAQLKAAIESFKKSGAY